MHISLAPLALLAATTLATPLSPPTTPATHPLSKREGTQCGYWSNQAKSYTAPGNYHEIPAGGACTNTHDNPDKYKTYTDKFWFYIDDRCDYCKFYTAFDCTSVQPKQVNRSEQEGNTWPGQLSSDDNVIGLEVIKSFSC